MCHRQRCEVPHVALVPLFEEAWASTSVAPNEIWRIGCVCGACIKLAYRARAEAFFVSAKPLMQTLSGPLIGLCPCPSPVECESWLARLAVCLC